MIRYVLSLFLGGVSTFVLLAEMQSLEQPERVKQFLAGPMANVEEVVFAVRTQVPEGHWYANIGYHAIDRNRAMYGKGGRLCKLNVRTGKLTVLLNDPEGAVRDPCVHYDGKRILFSYRRGGTENYLLYVINSDGTGLAQITQGTYDDYEPCWLPEGGIVFVTTRAKRWVNCYVTQVGNIWRCDADGQNMRALSANLEQDNTPWMLPDGRIIYTRWEYVDRSEVAYHHLWTMMPDGTSQSVFFGNLNPGGVFIDAKPIPGSDRVVLINSPQHGRGEHGGVLATLSSKAGPDELSSLRNVTKNNPIWGPGMDLYRDPWAFGPNEFMVANDNQLLVMQSEEKTNSVLKSAVLFTLPAEFGREALLHEPRPILPHPAEKAMPARVDLSRPNGVYLLENVTVGRNMVGVRLGEIKKLLIVETLPKPINISGADSDSISFSGTFTLERQLGTVPVEADGSAHFEAPAMRSLFFVALDAEGKSVKRMQSFTTVQPGETAGCIGCHEQRVLTRSPGGNLSLASRRTPSRIEPLKGLPDLVEFPRHIQPILDRHCLSCHDYDKRDGGVILTGDRGPKFSHSYYTLAVRGQLADARNQARSNYAPRKLGSGGAPLMAKLEGGHHGIKASASEKALVSLWLDLAAPYAGTYAALGCGTIGGYVHWTWDQNSDQDWPETKAAQPVLGGRCMTCHAAKNLPQSISDEIRYTPGSKVKPLDAEGLRRRSRHLVFNLTRPEKSLLLLAPLAKSAGGYGICKQAGAVPGAKGTVFASKGDPDYRRLLALCQAGKRKLEEIKRFDMPGFKPRAEYIREMKRFGILPESFDLANDPLDVYELDRKYWDSFIYQPQ